MIHLQYYEEAINNTSTDYAPWYVIPDDKEMCRYIVGKIIWEEMQKHTDIQTPEMDDKIEKHRIVQRDAGKR
jgi:hypothetical protein